MSSLLCLHVSLGQFLFYYKNYCHCYLPQSSCCVVIMLASRVIPLHHLDSLTFPILCQSVQLAKHFSPKREYNSTRLFGELCGVWCQLSQHMDLDLPCQCSHIICSDYNNFHPAPPKKKILTCIFALFSRVSKATYFTFQVLTRTHESAFTLEVLFEALFRSCNNHTGLRRVFFSLSKFSHCTPNSVCVRSVSLPFPFLIQGSGAFNRFANLPNVYMYKSFRAAFL